MDLFKPFHGHVYVGQALLRHEDEPTIADLEDGTKELAEYYPQCYPHIFVEIAGLSFAELLKEKTGYIKGSSGLIVDYQKLLRDRSNPEHVEAWRDKFSNMSLEEVDEMLEDCYFLFGDADEATFDVKNGGFFVVLNDTIKLDVPLPMSAKREKLAEIVDSEQQVEMLNDATVSILLEQMT